MVKMKALLVSTVSCLLLCSCSSEPEPGAARYPGPWSGEADFSVARILAKNQVRGCGEFYTRRATSAAAEYLCYCTPDGKRWNAYIVYGAIEKVEGPYRPFDDIPLPR